MKKAQLGNTVLVHYVGRLKDTSIFDDTRQEEPLEIILGEDELLPDFEKALVGMKEGQKKIIEIPVDRAYGPFDEDELYEIEPDQLPEDMEPEIGLELQIRMPNGRSQVMAVVGFNDETIVVDANHPLAGLDLIYEIELIEILDKE